MQVLAVLLITAIAGPDVGLSMEMFALLDGLGAELFLFSFVVGLRLYFHIACLRVLPVGGIKDKVLAAARAGIETVILPRRNEKDLVEVPDEVREKLDLRLADTIGDALETALGA